MTTETKKIEISQKTIIYTFSLILSLWFLYQVRSIIVLLFIAFILMTAVTPVIKLASKIKIPTIVVMLVVYFGLIALLSVVVASLVPAVVEQTKGITYMLPTYLHSLEDIFNTKLDTNVAGSYLSSIPSNILKIAAGAFSNIMNILALFFMSYYLVLERPRLHQCLLRFFPDHEAEEQGGARPRAADRGKLDYARDYEQCRDSDHVGQRLVVQLLEYIEPKDACDQAHYPANDELDGEFRGHGEQADLPDLHHGYDGERGDYHKHVGDDALQYEHGLRTRLDPHPVGERYHDHASSAPDDGSQHQGYHEVDVHDEVEDGGDRDHFDDECQDGHDRGHAHRFQDGPDIERQSAVEQDDDQSSGQEQVLESVNVQHRLVGHEAEPVAQYVRSDEHTQYDQYQNIGDPVPVEEHVSEEPDEDDGTDRDERHDGLVFHDRAHPGRPTGCQCPE